MKVPAVGSRVHVLCMYRHTYMYSCLYCVCLQVNAGAEGHHTCRLLAP